MIAACPGKLGRYSVRVSAIALLTAAFRVYSPITTAEAGEPFSVLGNVPADTMSAAEMDQVQGRLAFPIFPPQPVVSPNQPVFAPQPFTGPYISALAAAAGVTPAMVNQVFPGINASIQNGFSFGANSLSGINNINSLISQVTGVPFAPIQSPFPPNFPAAASGSLNTLLNLAGQPGLPQFR